jgi:MFS family permease
MQSSQLKQLSVLMATVFLDMVGGLMVLPILPFYARDMGVRPSLVTVIIAAFFFAQLVTAPLWGRFSDRYGRRPVLLLGLSISALAFAFFGLAASFLQLLIFRLIQGAGGGTTGVVQAYVSDSVPPEDRAKALGWISAATSAGVSIGPYLGSKAALLGHWGPGFLAAGLCFLNVVFTWRWLPESKQARVPTQAERDARRPLRTAIWDVLRHPGSPVSSLIWVYAFGMMAFLAMNSVLALYLGARFQVNEYNSGIFYSYVGVVSVVMRAVLLGPAVRRFGEVGVMRLGSLSLVLGLAGIPLAGMLNASYTVRLAALAFIVLFVPVGTALLFPATTALVSWRSRQEETGQIMGVQQSLGAVARVIGPLWAGLFYEKDVRYPFWLAAALMLGVSGLTWRQKETIRATSPPAPLPSPPLPPGEGRPDEFAA